MDDLDLTHEPPPRRVRLAAGAILTLGFGELLEVARATGKPYDQLSAVLRDGDAGGAAMVAVGLAWVLVRRHEPDVTWQDAQRWIIEVVPPDPPPPDPMAGTAS